MMSVSLLFAALFVAFPREGSVLPSVERCYVTGAVSRGATNVTVNGVSVPVFRTGAWATRVDVSEGTNELRVCAQFPGGASSNVVIRTVRVRPRPQPKPIATNGASTAALPVEKVWAKLAYAGDVPRPRPFGKSPGEITVFVDAGHGGAKDLGAISPHGGNEKDVNLLLAKAVRAALEGLGYHVVMTREDDRAVPLYERPRAAHEMGADAFISIHHNAPSADGDAASIRYSAVYAWNPIGEELAKAIATRMAASQEEGFPSRGVLHANFAVTRSPEIPSCLVEADFITHPAGEEAAWSSAVREKVAASIAAGFDDWCRAQPVAEDDQRQSEKMISKEDNK